MKVDLDLKDLASKVRQTSGSQEVLNKFKDKFVRKGVTGGVNFTSPSPLAEDFLKKVLQEELDYPIRINMVRFFKKLFQVRYQDLEGVENDFIQKFLSCYYNEEINPNSFVVQERDKFKEFLEQFDSVWVKSIKEQKLTKQYVNLKTYFNNNQVNNRDLAKVIKQVEEAIRELPLSSVTPLGVFAARITGNPHYFDYQPEEGLNKGLLFCYGLLYKTEKSINPSKGSRVRYNLFRKFNLKFNTTSSGVYHYNLKGISNNEVYSPWKVYNENNEYNFTTLEQLEKIDKIELPKKYSRVYAFENPNVFSEVKRRTGEVPLLCVRGKRSLAVQEFIYQLLISNDDITIYYSGDFDIAGLEIADNLKQEFGSKVKLWTFTKDIYNQFRTGSTEEIEEQEKLFYDDHLTNLYNNCLKGNNKLFEESLIKLIVDQIMIK